ncbi:MAG: sulfatase [Planctomycetota bacterium]
MKRWSLIMVLLCICVVLYLLRSGEDFTGDQVRREKRIVLLDRPKAEAGRFLPGNEAIPKLFRLLGREKRPSFTLQPDKTVVFDGLPVHNHAQLSFWLGSENPGESVVSLRIESKDSERRDETVFREAFSEPGWQSCGWPIDPAFEGHEIRLTFALSERPGVKEQIIGDPVLLSDGVAMAAHAIAPMKIEDPISNLLRNFDSSRKITSNEDRPLASTILRLDPEKRTVADDAKKVIRAAPDSEFVFTLELPASAILDVATFILPVGDPRAAMDSGNVEFSVEINGTRTASIRSDYINAFGAQSDFVNVYEKLIHWERIDLSPWAGQRVDLSFQTRQVEQPVSAGVEYAWWDLKIWQQLRIPRNRATANNPNVLILCIDALRADHLGCYGYGRETSENLDGISRESLLFENAVSPCSWTLPATASLLTGLHPNTHGVLGNTRNYLVDGITTLAEFLSVHGISTAAFTANELVCAAINFDQGFEQFVEVHDARAERLNDDLIAWMESCGPNQFFAYVHYMEPHSPYSAPDRFRQHFDPDYRETRDYSGPLPEWWRLGQVQKEFTPEETRHLVNLYDSEIYYWDFEFKRVLQAIERLSLKDRTIIIVTSDHGEEFFDHAGLGHGITLHQEVIHVPLILFDPRVKKGRRISEYVNSACLFSTVADRLGIKTPGFVQVESLFPLERISSRFSSICSSTERNHAEHMERWVSLIDPPFKRITGILGAGEMLFNLGDDPREMNDLLGGQPEKGRLMKEQALDWYRSTAEAFPDEWQPLTPEILQKLRDIGYIGGD